MYAFYSFGFIFSYAPPPLLTPHFQIKGLDIFYFPFFFICSHAGILFIFETMKNYTFGQNKLIDSIKFVLQIWVYQICFTNLSLIKLKKTGFLQRNIFWTQIPDSLVCNHQYSFRYHLLRSKKNPARRSLRPSIYMEIYLLFGG